MIHSTHSDDLPLYQYSSSEGSYKHWMIHRNESSPQYEQKNSSCKEAAAEHASSSCLVPQRGMGVLKIILDCRENSGYHLHNSCTQRNTLVSPFCYFGHHLLLFRFSIAHSICLASPFFLKASYKIYIHHCPPGTSNLDHCYSIRHMSQDNFPVKRVIVRGTS